MGRKKNEDPTRALAAGAAEEPQKPRAALIRAGDFFVVCRQTHGDWAGWALEKLDGVPIRRRTPGSCGGASGRLAKRTWDGCSRGEDGGRSSSRRGGSAGVIKGVATAAAAMTGEQHGGCGERAGWAVDGQMGRWAGGQPKGSWRRASTAGRQTGWEPWPAVIGRASGCAAAHPCIGI